MLTARGKAIPHRNMADDGDPPSLFNNVDIEHRDDDDNDDLFASAIESVIFLLNLCNCVTLFLLQLL
jgi:hypothetical protein